ncbi:hypothetical protein B0T14DRAFT_515119 [Immersiella caudata]|uniref:Uncharacterized protein n=1 Tax=Immersiella caudata TaxID=314043 RepID=A0AA39WWQ2_9PEZI|nr:hypothetical protein B0T14DRAFT_515119 [Immersiella caudata]
MDKLRFPHIFLWVRFSRQAMSIDAGLSDWSFRCGGVTDGSPLFHLVYDRTVCSCCFQWHEKLLLLS